MTRHPDDDDEDPAMGTMMAARAGRPTMADTPRLRARNFRWLLANVVEGLSVRAIAEAESEPVSKSAVADGIRAARGYPAASYFV